MCLGKLTSFTEFADADEGESANAQSTTEGRIESILLQDQCHDQHLNIISSLLIRNSDVFPLADSNISHNFMVQMEIDTGDHPLISRKPCRTPMASREMTGNMLRDEIITRTISKRSSPLVLLTKKDGTRRFVFLFLFFRFLLLSCTQCCDSISDISTFMH